MADKVICSDPSELITPVIYDQKMIRIYELANAIAPSRYNILITGETGTGKDLLARYIHQTSPDTRDSEFVSINCAAIPDELIESEIFGYRRGSFTGAYYNKDGLILKSNGGTLFLNDIDTMPCGMAEKLLEVTENKEYLSLGSLEKIKVNFRLICATNTDIKKERDEGRFRKDLYYRICQFLLEIPPLRERRGEIKPLIKYFLQKQNLGYMSLADNIQPLLYIYPWPGNIRELENTINVAAFLLKGKGNVIEMENILKANRDLYQFFLIRKNKMNLDDVIEDFTDNYISDNVTLCNGNCRKAADLIGTTPSRICRRMKRMSKQKNK